MKTCWTRIALQDLDHVREYVARDSPKLADELIERIAKSLEGLVSYPNLGRLGRAKGTRELVIVGTPYLVPYRIKKDRIEILAVLHGARRWPMSF